VSRRRCESPSGIPAISYTGLSRRCHSMTALFGLMVKDLTTYLRGWLGYFGDCQTPSVLHCLESWLRRRLRSVVRLRVWILAWVSSQEVGAQNPSLLPWTVLVVEAVTEEVRRAYMPARLWLYFSRWARV
jgi:hypothetical protein